MASAVDSKSPGTPSRAAPRLPAAIANASMEELQKMCFDTLKKLRDRDRRIKELTSTPPSPNAAVASGSQNDGQPRTELDNELSHLKVKVCS
jgi:hypothetical protein